MVFLFIQLLLFAVEALSFNFGSRYRNSLTHKLRIAKLAKSAKYYFRDFVKKCSGQQFSLCYNGDKELNKMNGVTYIMIYVEVFEILNTTFGVGLIVKNDIKYTVNQTICTQNGDKFKIRHIQLPTTPNVTDTICLICDNI